MEMSGQHTIPAPRETVWEALNDPEVLKQCIPGCEEVTKTSDTSFDAKVSAKVGPVKARFSGSVTLSDLDPPKGYTISGEGKGGAAGFAKGGAKVALEEAEGGAATDLSYEVNASVGGKLAQIGARLINSTAKKYANDFFTTFSEIAAERAKGGTATEDAAEQAAPQQQEQVRPQTQAQQQAETQQAAPAQDAAASGPAQEAAPEPAPKPAAKAEPAPKLATAVTPLVAEREQQGVPEDNVYEGTHWAVYLSYGLVALGVILFFVYAT